MPMILKSESGTNELIFRGNEKACIGGTSASVSPWETLALEA